MLDIVKATLPAVAEAGPAFIGHFYQCMFAAHPELLNTSNISNQRWGKQQQALFSAIAAFAVNVLEHRTVPLDLLEGPNQTYCALNVVPARHDVVRERILGTITDLLNPGQEVLDAWGELYGALAGQRIKLEEEIYKQVESLPGGWLGPRSFKIVEKINQSQFISKLTSVPVDGEPICDFSPGKFTNIQHENTASLLRCDKNLSSKPLSELALAEDCCLCEDGEDAMMFSFSEASSNNLKDVVEVDGVEDLSFLFFIELGP